MAPQIGIKFAGKELSVDLEPAETVGDLKRKLEELTNVRATRQKLLGLKTAQGAATDDTQAEQLVIKPGQKFMLMGTPEAVIEATQQQAEAAPEVKDDFDLSAEDASTLLDVKDRPEVQEKLARRLKSVKVKVLNPPRPGKKLAVYDIDYTIFDLNSSAERPEELARPYLHEHMAAIYEHFDIIIWSATSMKWVEVKMRELGVSTNPNYKITCMLDHASMVTVHTEKYGVFDCKPLQFIWSTFPEHYHEGNTIMFDDLRRNYIMNPQQGLVIRPFRKAHLTRDTDRELHLLMQYMNLIAPLPTLSHLDHSRWEDYISGRRPLPPPP